ncbi:MAG: prepilin peptidase [Candidatus Paceibacterota bacterium]|jgi:prepilin signal peptidase PulO-like enzyme (type II secretory pathway)
MVIASIFIFIFGLVVGSFLNCVAYRLSEKKSFVSGRSFCPKCKHSLAWYDLVPVFSFLFLKGKCRYCGKPISWQYPAVEIATGLIFLLTFNLIFPEASLGLATGQAIFNFAITLAYLFAIASLLIIIFIFDLKWYLIPDKVLFWAIGITAAFHFYSFIFDLYPKGQISNFLFSAFGASGFFLAIFLLTRGKAMGFGDVKLAFFMGFFLGWPKIMTALFLAFLIGAIIGLILIVGKKKQLKSEIPFGPFLVSGLFIALFWGEKIFDYYLNFFA